MTPIHETGGAKPDQGESINSPWSCLEGSSNPEEFFSGWLALQSSFITSAVQGLLIVRDPAGGAESYSPAARWQDPRIPGDAGVERLAEISERVLGERCGLLTQLAPGRAPLPAKGAVSYAIAFPVMVDGALMGAAAFELTARGEDEIRPSMEQLQWGISVLEVFFRREQSKELEQAQVRVKAALDLLAGVLAKEGFDEACMAFVTGAATLLNCDRVSLGFLRNRKVAVQAISHSASFDKRMKFIRSVGLAMDEAILQGREIIFPPPPDEGLLVTRDHEEIVTQFGAESLLTVPLYGNDRYYGAITLERGPGDPFTREEAAMCRSVFALAAPALEGKRLQDRPVYEHAWDSLKDTARRLFGAGHYVMKLVAALIAVSVVFFSFATGEFRVTAQSTLEGAVRRTIAAPFRGYIKEAKARAGDTVQEGRVICTLDDRDLRLEKSNLAGQQSQLLKQHQEAFANHDRAKLNVISAQLDQVLAQLNLNEIKLERIVIRAPFDGVLVSGDLSQKLGAVVEQGEQLFEIAPLSGYRLILQVEESDIADVRKGQRGKLVLSSLPDTFDFTVEKITPITTATEGKNCFRVEAKLDQASDKLRPGMEGVGKISVDERKLISIWTRKLLNWLRLWVWTWWP